MGEDGGGGVADVSLSVALRYFFIKLSFIFLSHFTQ